MHRLKSVLSALAVGLVLLASLDWAASAATGKPMILGKINKANQSTTLKNTGSGPALKLFSNGTAAPFAVNNTNKVTQLHADRLDGKSADELGVRTRIYRRDLNVAGVSTFQMTLPNVPAGTYLGTMNGWIYGPATANMECFLQVPSSGDFFMHSWNRADSSGFYTVGGSSAVVVPSTQNLVARCVGNPGSYNTFDGWQVSLTQVDQAQSLPSVPGRPGVRPSGRAAAR